MVCLIDIFVLFRYLWVIIVGEIWFIEKNCFIEENRGGKWLSKIIILVAIFISISVRVL